MDALIAAGVPKDDPALQRALRFVSRCQNLPGETNDQPFAKKTTEDDRGGLTYVPLDPDDNPHKTPEGGLRSLGAMTYGGLKSFLYAGVSKDDPRVKGAIRWIRHHYTLDENPGMKQAALYYYYHTFAKAMAALGEDRFEDARGQKHDWRQELVEAVRKRQAADGSFRNKDDRHFGEADPNLATAFALLALSYVRTPGQ
jgi:squalene-hopene/tetraprenyl-beta-curcumene cyclase